MSLHFGRFDRISTFSLDSLPGKTFKLDGKNRPTPMSPDVSSHFCAEKRSAMG